MRIGRFLALSGIVVAIACGPELTDPASSDVSGTWQATTPIGSISSYTMTLTQDTGGGLLGRWTGIASTAPGACPAGLGSHATDTISGGNSALEVELDIISIGQFFGQLMDANTLKGAVVSCQKTFAITFTRVNTPAP